MTKVKVIVFDLFETLIHDIKFEFHSGLVYLFENILDNGTDREEFYNYAGTYWKDLYNKRGDDNSELAFADELMDFKKRYGFKVNLPIEEIEYNCLITMNETELFEDTITTLEKLKYLGIPVYLLSNTIFKKNVMRRFINQYYLEKYFENTYFSANYGVRKPHKAFFQILFDEIKKENRFVNSEEVLFIGDSYLVDIQGAKEFGFTPVFINRNDNDINKDNFYEINTLTKLFELM